MTEHDEERPLTRRELRLRELAETGALDLSEATVEAPTSTEHEANDAEAAGARVEIEISPFNEDGTPRTRRELRELRAAALAELEAERVGETLPADVPEPTSPADDVSGAEPEEQTGSDDAAQSSATESTEEPGTEEPGTEELHAEELDFDTLMAPPTEPFSVEELRAAETSAATGFTEVEFTEVEAEAPVTDDAASEVIAETTEAGTDATSVAGSSDAAEALETPKPKKKRFWQRKEADAAGVVEEADPADLNPAVADEFEQPATTSGPDDASGELETAEELVVEDEAVEISEAESSEVDAPVAEPKPAAGAYSFPDIQPPEEWRSVFDDPASRTVPAQGGTAEAGDFDDLISRAVEQEGAGGSSSTSALILPTMPEDTGGLTGPLGATGELYLTGSIELPKSLGETGGHSTLHDSIQMEPISAPILDEDAVFETAEGPQPVAAKHAVSARASSGMSVVAKPAKEQSKLPIVLGVTGGGLLIVVVGLGIWAFSSGMFSG